jgi:plasmid stabilization system protein ParE
LPVVWRAKALADVSRIVRYIAADNLVAAKRVGREILVAGDSLVMFRTAAGADAKRERDSWWSCLRTSSSIGSVAPTW